MCPIALGVAAWLTDTGVGIAELARTVEEAGLESLFLTEHSHVPTSRVDLVAGDRPGEDARLLDQFTALGAAAACTSRLRLGTGICIVPQHDPIALAKQVATIDHVSNGRTVVGLGSGWFAMEFESYGLPFPPVKDRLQALDETAAALKRLWTEPSVTFEGAHVTLRDAISEPKPVRRPPILIGGGGEKVLMGIVARHADIWNNMGVAQAALASKIEALRRRCDDVGRDFATLEVSQQCLVVIAANETAAREALGKAVKIYGGHMGGGLEEHGIWGTPAQVIERIERHRALGCTHFVIELFGRDTREPARLFAEQVLPAFRK